MDIEFIMFLLRDIYHVQLSLNKDGELCDASGTCQTAIDWLKSIVAVFSFSQSKGNSCWVAGAVMLKRYHDSQAPINEKDFWKANGFVQDYDCEKISQKLNKKLIELRDNAIGSNITNNKLLDALSSLDTAFLKIDFNALIELLSNIRNTTIRESLKSTTCLKKMEEILKLNNPEINEIAFGFKEKMDKDKISWLRFYLRYSLNMTLPKEKHKEWFVDKIGLQVISMKPKSFTLDYFKNILKNNGPVLIGMPASKINNNPQNWNATTIDDSDLNNLHLVMFLSCEQKDGEDWCNFRNPDSDSKGSTIKWSALQKWIRKVLNEKSSVIFTKPKSGATQ